MFWNSNVNKSLFFLVSLKYREIITVKSLKSKKKKEAGTHFVLLCHSRNMVGQFKKAYLHRPIKFPHFLTRENSKMFNITSKYFRFFNNKPPAS